MAIKDVVTRFKGDRMPVRRHEEGGLFAFQREMNRLFDEFFRDFGVPAAWDRGEVALGAFTPRVNVSEDDKEISLSAELPGMDEKDVSVEVDETSVTIRGERKEEKEEKGTEWHRQECSYGSFSRVIPLPARVDVNKANARFKKGVLSVSLPKRAEDQRKRKTVTVESA